MRPRHVWSGTSGRQRRLRARATTHIAYLILMTLCLAFRHVDCNTGEAGFHGPYAPTQVTLGRPLWSDAAPPTSPRGQRTLCGGSVGLSHSTPEHLRRNHPDRLQPCFHELRPTRDGRFCRSQRERMPTLDVQVHLRRNAGLPERPIVDERVLYWIYGIVLRLKQERGRRPAGDLNVGVQREVFLADGEMSGIQSHREIRAATLVVGGIHSRVETLLEMGARRGDQVPTRRKAQHSDLPRIDLPLRSLEAYQAYRPLRVFQRRQAILIRPDLHAWHTVFQEHTRDALGRQPITDFRAFKVDGQNVVAPAGEDDDRSTRVASLWRIDGHRRLGDAVDIDPRSAGNQPVVTSAINNGPGNLRPVESPRVRDDTRPYRHLRVSWRRPPGRRLRAQTAKRAYDAERDE